MQVCSSPAGLWASHPVSLFFKNSPEEVEQLKETHLCLDAIHWSLLRQGWVDGGVPGAGMPLSAEV
jgi:hypothetical protein